MAEIRKNQTLDEVGYVNQNQLSNGYQQSGDAMTAKYTEVAKNTDEPAKSGSGTTANDDYYQLARDQEYGLLFDKEIQLENARANAQKYTMNSINAKGFGGTGYGSTIQSGIYNQYMNQLSNAQQDYNSNIKDINLQEKQANEASADDGFQSVTTMLSQAGTKEQMDSLLEDYGYMKNGEFVEKKPEGMSDDDWYQIKYYYNLYSDDLTANKADNVSALNNMQYTDSNNKVGTMGERFQEEIKYLGYQADNGQVPDGSIICVQNASGDTVYLKYSNGSYSMSSFNDYESAKENMYLLKYKDGKNEWSKVK